MRINRKLIYQFNKKLNKLKLKEDEIATIIWECDNKGIKRLQEIV